MGGAGAGAIMIGDSATDVATARAAGVPVILVSYGYTPEPAQTLGADAVTDDFAEIPRLVRRLIGAQSDASRLTLALAPRRLIAPHPDRTAGA